ncbi:MAG: M48 family metallopeptidase [Rhodobacteraceae bacterium]|nr:M48 family metallopeptidase [Paracoccaceae bacterium]
MTIFLKLLPFLLLGVLVWRMATAGERLKGTLMRESKPLSDWELLEPVRDFARALEVDNFQVRVLDMDAVNGVALPGGEIFISRGLYEKFLTGEVGRDEVSAVIAHEIGHVALGHHKRRLRAWQTETAALAVLWFLLSRIMLGWVGLLAVLGLSVMRSQMSQQDEFEADLFSAQLMSRANSDPAAIIRLLSKLDQWTGGGEALGLIKWLMSHPPISERITRLEAALSEMSATDPTKPQADGLPRGGIEV